MCTASSILSKVKDLTLKRWTEFYTVAKGGRHTRDLDGALPIVHTRALYDHLHRPKPAILAQMRTGKYKLKAYLHSIGVEDSGLCECGQRETVKHVVLDCGLWNTESQELRTAVVSKSRWGDLHYLLGRWSGRKDPAGREVHRWGSSVVETGPGSGEDDD